MRKIFIILCCFGILSAHATEMCARNDTVVIPLDATITQKGIGYNTTEWIWWKVYEYGTIYGAATCLSKKEIMMYSDWNGIGQVYGGNVLNTADDELIGASGYYMNADVNPDIPDEEKGDYKRIFCYAKITHPMSSNWVQAYVGRDCNVSNCLSNYIVYDFVPTNVFNSIGTQPPWEE